MRCHCCENETRTSGAKHCSYECRSNCPNYKETRRRLYHEKTGFDHQSQNPLVKERKKQTNLTRYGVASTWQLQDVKGENNPFFGKKHTAEALMKMRSPDQAEQVVRYKTKKMCFGLLWSALRSKGKMKTMKTYETLGYRPEELKQRLQSQFTEGMTWENHGRGKGKWNIDHIRPINTFSADTPPAVINALSNLRPLWSELNLRRPKDGSDIK